MKKFSHIVESNSSSKFKLGIDVHGVADTLPKEFSFLSSAVINAGGEVHIITGGSWTSNMQKRLKELGIKWTHSFSIYDHLLETNSENGKKYQFKDGSTQVEFPDEIWNKAKGDYCRENNISLHIDDTTIYGKFFTTPFARIWTKGTDS